MRTSVGSDGAVRSPGRYCMKSLKTAADFQTSSSSFPSITGGLSKRVRRVGVIFSGVSSAASRAAELPGTVLALLAAPDAGGTLVAAPFVEGLAEEFDGALAGDDTGAAGVGVGVASPFEPEDEELPPDCF